MSEDKSSEGLEDQLADLKNKWLTALADVENMRKDYARDLVETLRRERGRVAMRLVPLLDDLDLVIEKESERVSEALKTVQSSFLKALKELGVETIDPKEGDSLNPAEQEAVQTIERDLPPNQICHVVRRGYKLEGVVLRSAKVVVVKGA